MDWLWFEDDAGLRDSFDRVRLCGTGTCILEQTAMRGDGMFNAAVCCQSWARGFMQVTSHDTTTRAHIVSGRN